MRLLRQHTTELEQDAEDVLLVPDLGNATVCDLIPVRPAESDDLTGCRRPEEVTVMECDHLPRVGYHIAFHDESLIEEPPHTECVVELSQRSHHSGSTGLLTKTDPMIHQVGCEQFL